MSAMTCLSARIARPVGCAVAAAALVLSTSAGAVITAPPPGVLALNPQPEPPGSVVSVRLNPQPEPPGRSG